MSASPSLAERLPADVALSILLLLSYHDILSMRKTCRTLAAISRQRGLWVNKLKVICEKDTVFLPSFPLERMSVEELEAVASGPMRFDSLAKRYGETEAQMDQDTHSTHIPRHERTLTFDVSSSENVSLNPSFSATKLYLIPGGRFLVLVCRTILQLWDLGVFLTEGSRKDPRLIAGHVSAAGNAWRWASAHTNAINKEESIRLAQFNTERRVFSAAKCLEAELMSRHKIQVFEIFPSAPHPEFKVIGTTRALLRGLVCTSICGDLLVLISFGRTIKLWNFIDNTWACFGVDKRPIQILLTPTAMNLIHADGVSVWNIPHLTVEGYSEEPDTKVPLFFIPYPPGSGPPEHEGSAAIAHYSSLCDWYTGRDQPLLFDYQNAYHPETLSSFLLETTSSAGLRLNTAPSLGGFSKIHLPDAYSSLAALPSRVVGGKQVRMFGTETGLACLAVQDSGGGAQAVFLKIDLAEESEYVKSFCPFSGRLCYCLRMLPESSKQIRILDFFV